MSALPPAAKTGPIRIAARIVLRLLIASTTWLFYGIYFHLLLRITKRPSRCPEKNHQKDGKQESGNSA